MRVQLLALGAALHIYNPHTPSAIIKASKPFAFSHSMMSDKY
jgi:hypothetical protein